MPAADYLKQTEPAVQHMFLALDLYRGLTLRPSLEKYRQDDGGIQMTRDEAIKFLRDESNAMGLDIAKATLSGAIIQVAYSGIKQYSTNKKVSKSCRQLGIPIKGKAKFCVGREIHSLPIGLIIYAARIQYNHWEEGTPKNPTAKDVFTHLRTVHLNDPWHDLVYELNWPRSRPVTHHVLQLELEWNTYNDYLSDMKQMLSL